MIQASRSPEVILRRAARQTPSLKQFIEEPIVRPKELHRDTNGLTRLDSIEHADRLVAEARQMAADWTANPNRGFSHYGDDDCGICDSAHACGLRWYEDVLVDAAEIYRERGLGMLADRVDAIRHLPPNKAWVEFDETNAATEV